MLHGCVPQKVDGSSVSGCRLVLGVCAGPGITHMRTGTYIAGRYAPSGSGIRDPGARFMDFLWVLDY
jgi:hypothetical protein